MSSGIEIGLARGVSCDTSFDSPKGTSLEAPGRRHNFTWALVGRPRAAPSAVRRRGLVPWLSGAPPPSRAVGGVRPKTGKRPDGLAWPRCWGEATTFRVGAPPPPSRDPVQRVLVPPRAVALDEDAVPDRDLHQPPDGATRVASRLLLTHQRSHPIGTKPTPDGTVPRQERGQLVEKVAAKPLSD